jgi:hypothetical protein
MSANDAIENAIENVGERLLAALTQDEIERLLDALWAESSGQWEGAITHLSPDTQVTVRQLIVQPLPDHSTPDQEAPIAIAQRSHAKLSQIWSELWQEWWALVTEASEEDGRYIQQEASWEPPYFDDYAFAEDLDAVAAKMRSHLQSAFEQGLVPEEGFAPALIEAEAEITAGIPEWIGFMDGIGLGKQVTHCLLAWEWLTIQAQGQDGYQFALRIKAIDSELAQMSLDDNELIGFLWDLPQAEQRCLVAGITAHKDTDGWQALLGKTASVWYLYYMEKVSESSPKDYLNNLRETISQKWSNGLPVIEDLLTNEDYGEGLTVILETLVSRLKSSRQSEPWTPESSLLVTLVAGYAYEQESFEQEKTLLSYWQTIAEALGQTQKRTVLEVQKRAFDDCFNWQKMFETFADISVDVKTHQALFQSWREYVVQRATPHRGWAYGYVSSTESGWLHWLIDSIAEPKKGAQWFQKKMSKWVKGLAGDLSYLSSECDLLRLLTRDLQAIQPDRQQVYPTFDQVVIRVRELSAPDDASRQAYLRQFASDDLWSQVMAYWQANLHQFVPDPRSVTKSDYTQHARWLLALKEVSPRAHATLLAQWKTEHLRRINLWKAIAKADK